MSEKRIDYVIVVDRTMRHPNNTAYLIKFIQYLEQYGLKLKIERGKIEDNLYVTVHLPKKAVQHFANMYDINIENPGHTFLPVSSISLLHQNFFQTPYSDNKDLFKREGKVTNKERIMIAEQIMNEARYGDSDTDCGIGKLIRSGAVTAAFPLHDGDCGKDRDEESFQIPENDRQILLKYWANFSLWYKEQPLNLIEKYFGTEVAFYFAWLGFYNKMLIPASIVGLVCSFISVIHLLVVTHERVDDICNSDIQMCPLCHSGKNCDYQPLKLSCEYATLSIIFDNQATVFFAVFMSFWATTFTNLWKRVENTLKIRWNVDFEEMDTKLRVHYKEKTPYKKWSSITGTLEPYTPSKIKAWHLTLSYGTSILLVIIVLLFVFSMVMYQVALHTAIRMSGSESLEIHASFLLQMTSAWIQVGFIKLFGIFYAPLSEWLTDLENPRTQSEFDNSVIHKRYFLGFANNYASLFYIAFMKGRFYSPHKTPSVTMYEKDLCQPTGCLLSLFIQLCVFMLFKSLVGNILTLILPPIKRKLQITKSLPDDSPQWEKEFKLYPANRYLLTTEFMEMVIQYGFVTFFVAAFPLAPLCALINNCLELRLDAYKLVTRYRRPLPKQQSGIGAWNGVIDIITQLSVATNAFVLAFTSDFVIREIYKYNNNDSLSGYIKSTLSLYDMKDYKGSHSSIPLNPVDNSTLCYYKGSHHPPDHPEKYTLSPKYWYEIGMRLACVIIFEHVILLTNGFLSYFIPDVPQNVKETLHYNRTRELELKLMAQDETTRALRRRTPSLKINRSENLKDTKV